MTVEGLTFSVTHRFARPIEAVWALLTDVEQMAGLGPEHVLATWDGDDRGLGATFLGTNRRGNREWTVPCTVVICERPTAFAWDAGEPAEPFATWSYDLSPDDTGTTVTQTFTHRRGVSGISAAVAKHPEAEHDIVAGRSAQLQENMRIVLTETERLLAPPGSAAGEAPGRIGASRERSG